MKLKELLLVMGFVVICFVILLIGADRIKKIENGEMILVSQREK